VAAGEWRDYRISCRDDASVFAVFRGTAEYPLYRIEKRPGFHAGRPLYRVSSMSGQILKGGQELGTVLRVLDRKRIRSVDYPLVCRHRPTALVSDALDCDCDGFADDRHELGGCM